MPGENDSFSEADAIMVAPARFNTLNKWVLGIADTLAVGILCEYFGRDVPIVAPCLKQDLARHPAFPKSRSLTRGSVSFLYEPNTFVSPKIVLWENMLHEIAILARTDDQK